MPRLIARWNPARDAWETETTGLFCEHSDVFSGTWPTAGMTRGGVAFELPTWEHRTDGSACSSLLSTPQASMPDVRSPEGVAKQALSPYPDLYTQVAQLLPTPSVADGTGGHINRSGDRKDELLLPGIVLTLLPTPRTSDTNGTGTHGTGGLDLRTAVEMLPTPMARDWKGENGKNRNTLDPPSRVLELLPTPRASDGTNGGPNQRGSSGDLMLPSAVQLLPTPRASDGPDESSHRRSWSTTDRNLHTLVKLGELTNPPSDGGNEC